MMQKVAWNAMNSRCGIVDPSRGSKVTSFRNAWPRPPMNPLPSSNASEYPTSAQVTVATASAATHIMNVFRVFFERTRPA